MPKRGGNKATQSPEQLSENTASTAGRGSGSIGTESLDKIRDILFGAQAENYEKRFTQLESRLIHEYSEMKAELQQRHEALTEEIHTLRSRLNDEQDKRSKEISDLGGRTDKGMARLDERITEVSRDLERIADALGRSKADRSVLADLLVHMAAQLNADSSAGNQDDD